MIFDNTLTEIEILEVDQYMIPIIIYYILQV